MQRYRPIRLILSLVAAINIAFGFLHVLYAELTLIAALNLTVITAAVIWPLWLAWRRAERLTPDALRVQALGGVHHQDAASDYQKSLPKLANSCQSKTIGMEQNPSTTTRLPLGDVCFADRYYQPNNVPRCQ